MVMTNLIKIGSGFNGSIQNAWKFIENGSKSIKNQSKMNEFFQNGQIRSSFLMHSVA